MKRGVCWISAAMVLLMALSGCGGDGRGEAVLNVYHAGSLACPFGALEEQFERANPGVDVRSQAHGSAVAVRQVTELGKPGDVVGVADYTLIDEMMIRSEEKWTDWNVQFATNEMVIALGSDAPDVTTDNWQQVLARDEVTVGFSNPRHDPCGYRALMVLYLSRKAGGPRLLSEVVVPNSNIELKSSADGAVIQLREPVNVEGRLRMRSKETDIVSLLQTGALDCGFLYRSVAVQQGLDYVELPPELNLGSPEHAQDYASVTVRMKPGEGATTVRGRPISYGVTIPKSVRHRKVARDYVRMLLSDVGSRALEDCGLRPLDSPVPSQAGRAETPSFLASE
ncbi:MAG: tungstate ABC transporter substrate-binding protein WtpA [Planctomycetota bacterium]